jgi:cytochrome c-type biogenesis protein CcmH
MLMFVLFAGLIAAATVALLLFPLLSGRNRPVRSRNALNAALYAEQLADLEADVRSGAITAQQRESAARELKARLIADVDSAEAPALARRGRGAAIGVGISVPLLAVAVYLAVGNPQLLGQKPQGEAAHQIAPHEVEAMVEKLAERLKTDSGNVEGWKLLARSYAAFGRFKESAEAYATAAKLSPGDAQLFADYADTLGMALGRKLEGEPEKLIARALEIDPRNLKALWLAGTVALERKDYKGAVAYWERLLPLVAPDSDDARDIRANVDEARALEKGAPAPQSKAAPPTRATAPKSVVLRGEVKLAAALAAQAAPGDTVFIFARAVNGPPAPLAVLRKKVGDLPVQFALDDSMAMAAGASLSGSPQVIVGARISKSGTPAPQPGDLQGLSAPVANDASGVTIVIDSVVR